MDEFVRLLARFSGRKYRGAALALIMAVSHTGVGMSEKYAGIVTYQSLPRAFSRRFPHTGYLRLIIAFMIMLKIGIFGGDVNYPITIGKSACRPVDGVCRYRPGRVVGSKIGETSVGSYFRGSC